MLAGGLFAVSRLSWQWSVVAEVFTLNNLFVGVLLLLIASFHRAKNAGQRRKVRVDISFSAARSCWTDRGIMMSLSHCSLHHLSRLHTGGRCAVVWDSVTSTPWSCMCWSSFPGCFINCILTE